MDNLGVIELYEKSGKSNSVKEFQEKTNSTLRVETKRKIASKDTEWLDVIENTIPYIDNIFRKPNRFIVNEEEIVKIEQTKKVTVETIKHLSKNTNLIQTIDEKTGDVTPSKLLNVRKEESYNTYENRLIYTLVQNTRLFIKKKTDELLKSINAENEQDDEDKNSTKLEYNATSEVKDEKVNVQVKLNSEIDPNGDESKDKNQMILDRIQEVKNKLDIVSNAEPYKVIDKLHITLVKEPIRKTNVVLKNVNFQYAMKLWSYLRENFDEMGLENADEDKNYNDQGELKQYIDETFLLQYLAMKTIDEDKVENEITYEELKEKMVEQMLEKIVDMENNDETENVKNVLQNKENNLLNIDLDKLEVQIINKNYFKLIINKQNVPDIIELLIHNNIKIYQFKEEKISLEDAFLKRTGGNVIG